MTNIIVIANKDWEVEPLVNVVLSKEARPDAVEDVILLNHPFIEAAKPRARVKLRGSDSRITIWAVKDLKTNWTNGSSTQEKFDALPVIFNADNGGPPFIVVAFGTAGYFQRSMNGCVTMGSNVFVHDCHPKPENPDSQWTSDRLDQLIASEMDSRLKPFFNAIGDDLNLAKEIRARLIAPPNCPAATLDVDHELANTALSKVLSVHPKSGQSWTVQNRPVSEGSGQVPF